MCINEILMCNKLLAVMKMAIWKQYWRKAKVIQWKWPILMKKANRNESNEAKWKYESININEVA